MDKIVENVIVRSEFVKETDAELLFGDEAASVHFTDCTKIENLCKELGIFPSVSEAKRAGRVGPIPSGWTDAFKASKTRRLWIWNPNQ